MSRKPRSARRRGDSIGLIEERLARFGSRPGLERMAKIMDALGNPHGRMRVIIVAGTNGKGSAASCISSILTAAGKKTGSYYSPHLLIRNERIRIGGRMIGDKRLEKYEREILALHDSGMEMTEFEAYTAVCYRYFADEKAEFAVMEAGMGGEFDATAIAKPEVGVITNAALEHTEYLGKTVEEIARTKAGMLAPRSVCVTGCAGAALEAVLGAARQKGAAQVSALGRDFFVKPAEISRRRTAFNYLGKTHYAGLETALLGRHQADNAGIAVAAIEELKDEIPEDAIRKGLLAARNPGRLQVLSEKPLLIADAAHNPAGMGALLSSLGMFDFGRLIVVFGVRKNKDWRGMLDLLSRHADRVIFTKAGEDAAESPERLSAYASQFMETAMAQDPESALAMAKGEATEKDMILVCGSIFMLGELMRSL